MALSSKLFRPIVSCGVALAIGVGGYQFFEAQKAQNIEKQRYGTYGQRIAELRGLASGDVCNRAVARELTGLLIACDQTKEAAEALDVAVGNCPFDLGLSELSARLWRKSGYLQRALAISEVMVKERPMMAAGYAVRAGVRFDLGRTRDAIADYRQVFEFQRGNVEAARALTDALESGGNPCEAADVLDQMLARRRPDDAEWLESRSRRLRLAGACPRERVEGGEAIVPFSLDSEVMLVRVRFNNRLDATMVLDTGASAVTLTRDFALRLGLSVDDGEPYYVSTAGGAAVAYRVLIDEVRMGGAKVKRVGAAIVPNMQLGDSIDGLLGNTFLSHFRVKVDSASRHVVLETLD